MIRAILPSHGPLAPFGLLLHSTGNGLADKCLAEQDHKLHIQTAVEVYSKLNVGPHYVIAPGGQIAELRKPNTIAYHAGVSAADRAAYLDGSWETNGRTPGKVVNWWKLNHPGVKSPQHLYPTKSPNESYVGVELVPCGTYTGNTWAPTLGTPATSKGRYTAEQYITAVWLGLQLAGKFAWPASWWEGSRLVGHEDIDPKDRPGWDPGAYNGWFSWSLFRGLMRGAYANVLSMGDPR